MRRRDMIFGAAALVAGPGLYPQVSAQTTPAAASSDTATVPAPRVVQLARPYPAPGEVHVVPGPFTLYWTLEDGKAIAYPIRIGRGDLYEPGIYDVGAKKEWPSWTPTPGMIAREPEKYARFAETGIPGGPGNPLGARALYLFTDERGDTFLRIHGTDDPSTIGRAVSNGCAGLINEHVIDLYDRVPVGARVVLYPKGDSVTREG
ncbi:L,D-transpeptidase [Sagittula salina]|uniref:L,D-transpeptidase n=1 Tax=Sagittula salina TaxID=2820268 RepID=A0A940MNC3_9RHOB|nr:L,D-transpeptidase [Sagittula salina]MBP0482454.1 L,D-transpeptidase [Sagittula salina]